MNQGTNMINSISGWFKTKEVFVQLTYDEPIVSIHKLISKYHTIFTHLILSKIQKYKLQT